MEPEPELSFVGLAARRRAQEDAMEVERSAEAADSRVRRGRGFVGASDREPGMIDEMDYETYEQSEANTGRAQKSVEGYVICATNINDEATEEDLYDVFSEYGPISNLHLNLDRRSGYVKGYAFVEYATYAEAKAAVTAMNGKELLTKTVAVDFAFSKSSVKGIARIAGP
ncbi:hypothetical protein H9P43_000590 [Blastocladiella emersonii ATCC 22665]|nr:hypothetical protein H9P43_000590 [Blastocladiella emersonii ATCC 22665]